MLMRLLVCILVGMTLGACEEAPPPPAPPAPVHVSGFPVGHPLNPGPEQVVSPPAAAEQAPPAANGEPPVDAN